MDGHYWLHLNKCNNVTVHDNIVQMRSNNVLRGRDSSNRSFFNNTCIGTNLAYAPAIQLKNINLKAISSNIQIYENTIYNAYGPGIWLIGEDKTTLVKDITIRNNLITKRGLMPTSTRI